MADMKANPASTNNQASTAQTASVTKRDLSYDDKVVEKIVGLATKEIPGVIATAGGLAGNLNSKLHVTNQQTTGIDAEVGKKQVAIDLSVVCEYGKYVPEVFDTVIAKVTKAVKDMTGLDVVEVNMQVKDVLSTEDFNKLLQQQNQSVRENFGMGQQQGDKPQQSYQADAPNGYAPRVQ